MAIVIMSGQRTWLAQLAQLAVRLAAQTQNSEHQRSVCLRRQHRNFEPRLAGSMLTLDGILKHTK